MAHTKLTEKAAAAVCKAIVNGDTREEAAARAGVHRDTIYEWLARGEKALRAHDGSGVEPNETEAPFLAFALRYRRAQAQYARRTRGLALASPKGWERFRYALAVAFPDSPSYGTRQVHEHQGPGGGPIKHEHDVSSDDLLAALDAFARRPAAAGDGPGDAGAGGGDADPGAEDDPRA